MTMKLIDWMMGRTRILVTENERVLALHKGRFIGILGPIATTKIQFKNNACYSMY